jgi:hypothetical protein
MLMFSSFFFGNGHAQLKTFNRVSTIAPQYLSGLTAKLNGVVGREFLQQRCASPVKTCSVHTEISFSPKFLRG